MNFRSRELLLNTSRTLMVVLVMAAAGCAQISTSGGYKSKAARDEAVGDNVALGMAYLRNGDSARAKQPLQRALDIDPRSSKAHNALAYVYQLDEEWLLAEQHYRNALQYDPSNTAARNNFGTFLYKRKRYAEAETEFERASQDTLYISRPLVFVNLGLARLGVNDQLGAEFAFNRALTLNPDLPRAHLELADILFSRGEKDQALFHYKRFAGLSRQTARSLWLGIRLQQLVGDRDAEASYVLQLKNMFPQSDEYRAYRESQ